MVRAGSTCPSALHTSACTWHRRGTSGGSKGWTWRGSRSTVKCDQCHTPSSTTARSSGHRRNWNGVTVPTSQKRVGKTSFARRPWFDRMPWCTALASPRLYTCHSPSSQPGSNLSGDWLNGKSNIRSDPEETCQRSPTRAGLQVAGPSRHFGGCTWMGARQCRPRLSKNQSDRERCLLCAGTKIRWGRSLRRRLRAECWAGSWNWWHSRSHCIAWRRRTG